MDYEFALEDTYPAHTNGKALHTSAQDHLSYVCKRTSAYPLWIACD